MWTRALATGMAAESHGGGPRDETIRISSETRARLQDWGGAEGHDEEVLQELLDEAEFQQNETTWSANDYY